MPIGSAETIQRVIRPCMVRVWISRRRSNRSRTVSATRSITSAALPPASRWSWATRASCSTSRLAIRSATTASEFWIGTPSCSSATTRCISLFIGSEALSTTTASAPAKLWPEREERPPGRAGARVDQQEGERGRGEGAGDDRLGRRLDLGDLEGLLEARPEARRLLAVRLLGGRLLALVALQAADRDELGHPRRQVAAPGLDEPDHEQGDDRGGEQGEHDHGDRRAPDPAAERGGVRLRHDLGNV